MPHPDVLRDMKLGDRLLLDDGQLEFVVQRKHGNDDVDCEVVDGGPLIVTQGRERAGYAR